MYLYCIINVIILLFKLLYAFNNFKLFFKFIPILTKSY